MINRDTQSVSVLRQNRSNEKQRRVCVYGPKDLLLIVCDKTPDRMTNDHVGHLVRHIVRWGFCATVA